MARRRESSRSPASPASISSPFMASWNGSGRSASASGRGRTVVSLVSEDLAANRELAEKTLEAARAWQPRLILQGVSAPCVRCLVDEREEEKVITELHERVFE